MVESFKLLLRVCYDTLHMAVRSMKELSVRLHDDAAKLEAEARQQREAAQRTEVERLAEAARLRANLYEQAADQLEQDMGEGTERLDRDIHERMEQLERDSREGGDAMSEFDRVSREAQQAAAEVKRAEQQALGTIGKALTFLEQHLTLAVGAVCFMLGVIVGHFIR